MCEKEFALNRNVVGACDFAVAAAGAAGVSFHSGNFGIIEHGFFLAALGYKIVMIAHDGVDRNTVRAVGFAFTAGVAAIEFPASLSICIQLGLVGFG